jgi:periplasmic protein TonB
MSDKDGGKVTPAMPAGEGESKEDPKLADKPKAEDKPKPADKPKAEDKPKPKPKKVRKK